MVTYFHSVRLDLDKCKGCTNCIKGCPTEAIRVRDGKAHIIEERCIDCGECIRICPNHAKYAFTDPLERLRDFAYTIALPAPSFYAQFRNGLDPNRILAAILELGFDDVYEVALAAEAITVCIREVIRKKDRPRPLISSACPTIVRLMQVRFPDLLVHIIPIESPMEIAAKRAKDLTTERLGIPREQIGAFFITPCAAKVTAVKQPVGAAKSDVDGAIAAGDVVTRIIKNLSTVKPKKLQQASGKGVGWGMSGGENEAVGIGTLLHVNGIKQVTGVLEEIERGKLTNIDYIECQACSGGCVGGPLMVENPFVAHTKLQSLAKKLKQPSFAVDTAEVKQNFLAGYFDLKEHIKPRPVLKLDANQEKAIVKYEQLEATLKELPGLDCGACGAPTCRALAEDIVRGRARKTDCTFKLREHLQSLAEEVVELARRLPPAMGTTNNIKEMSCDAGQEHRRPAKDQGEGKGRSED